MKFTFNGAEFRIVFRHDPSRMIGDHIGHNSCIMRHDRFGIVMQCTDCRVIIGSCMHTLPKALRVRKTWCAIQYNELKQKLDRGEEVSGIYLNRGRHWADLVTGCGTPNVDKGDTFNRAEGRMKALSNALRAPWPDHPMEVGVDIKAFREAAWKAFHDRRGPYNVTTETGPAYETVLERQISEAFVLQELREGK